MYVCRRECVCIFVCMYVCMNKALWMQTDPEFTKNKVIWKEKIAGRHVVLG
jgi:hypothetical protein